MKGRYWTLVLPYYENAGMLKCWLDVIHSWGEDDREAVKVIVVDDCSPTSPAGQVLLGGLGLGFDCRLYRIGVDVRWNWIACRNLAMAEATTEWRLMTDIDHLVDSDLAYAIRRTKLKPEWVYRFHRRDLLPDGSKPVNPKDHPNSWLLTSKTWEKTGGYDERFSGFYGTDGMFRDRVKEAAKRVTFLEGPSLIRVPRETIPDASTTTYERKQPEDRENVPRIRSEIQASGDLKPHRLTFPWERLL